MRLLIVLLFPIVRCLAQVSSGSLLGDVTDQGRGLMSGVRITARSISTHLERRAVTGATGSYRIDELPPGAYEVSAARDGFRTAVATPVIVEIDQKARFDFRLQAGAAPEQVTVHAQAAPLQTDEASEGYSLDSSMRDALPINGRDITSLVTLGPGAIPRQLGGFGHDIINDLQAGRGAVSLNPPVNGARSTSNTYILDGSSNTDRNTFAIAVMPPMESVAEFRIQSSLAPAEFAQAGGAVVDITTKSGGARFHGDAFEFFQNEAPDAQGFFSDPTISAGVVRQNQFGASLGGPLTAGTFFFGTYEGLRGRTASPTRHTLPDALVRNGDFTGRSTIFDPLGTNAPFPNNVIPASRIDPVVRKYLNLYEPLPNRPSDPVSNYIDASPNVSDNDSGSIRIDRGWGERSRLFGRYTINEDGTQLAGAFPERPTSESLRAQQAALGYTAAGATWVNEVRFGFTRLRVFDVPLSAFGTDVLANLGIHGFSNDPFTYGLPSLVVTNFDTVQDSSTLPQLQRDNLWSASENFSRSQGRHTWKTGFQLLHTQIAYLQSQFSRGQYLFNGQFTEDPSNPGNTGDPFADFLLGYAAMTKRNVGTTQAYLRQNSYAGYVQDDWQIVKGISLSVGLRYEYIAPFTEARNSLLNLVYPAGHAQPALSSVSSGIQPDRTNFAPRIGLAARLPWSSVFRAGYGIYYSPEIAVETYDLLRNGVRNEINESTSAPLLTLENGFPQTGSTGFPSYFGVDPKARTPYVQQWAASLQHEAPGHVLTEVAYIGTKGTRLGRFRRFNTPAHVETGENLPPREGDLQELRTWPALGTIFQREHLANSIYHSLQIKAEKRMTGHFSLLTSFVWSKSIDNADSIVPGQYESFGAQDERNLRLERGLSFFDVRRRLSAGFVASIPGFAGILGRGWQTSGTVILQDGTPLNPVYFATDFANSGTPNRPNVVLGQKVGLPGNQRTADRFFNTDAFSDPVPFTFGNAGRDILPGPGNEVIALALHREFHPRENWNIEFRAESFNLLNHPNIGIPGPYPDFGPFFGKAFSAGDPRRLQFGVRFSF